VPPIFQPEVAAQAIVWTAHSEREEVYVGFPTVEAIVGNKIAPRWLDRYLAKTGYKSQQTNEPDDHDRPVNLWSPVPGDHGAHGTFDRRAYKRSLQLWADMHRTLLLTCVGAGLAGALAGLTLNRRF
jgi:hypothetical protein